MKYKVEYIKLKNISIDQKFNLNTNFGFSSLEESINSVGNIYPLLGWNCHNFIILVDGFKRFKIANYSGKNELPFILMPSNLNLDEIVKIRYYNIKQENTELNAYQKLSFFSILKESDTATQTLDSWQRILNLSQFDKYRNILNWPQTARDYIYNYNVSIKQLQFLINQNNRVINEIFSIATSLSMRIVELTNIAEMISEIALNENVSVLSILERKQIESLMQNEDLNRNQKILKLKKTLYEWRYPTIAKFQRRLDDQLKKLSFNENTQIHYDKSFEKPEIILSTKFRRSADLKTFAELISNESNVKTFENILASL